MKNIALLNTAIFSFNQGDYIIMESAKKGLQSILNQSFVVEIPTHSPMFHVKEFGIRKNNSFYEKLQNFDYKFVCGTNLLSHNMKFKKTTWNINTKDTKYFGDVVLVGVGTDPSDEEPNAYTKKLYKQVLSSEYIHSVRDERTKRFLESMGFKAINTGCATMWGLNEEHCKKIPTKKSDTVVFTLTDYMIDQEKDRKMIEILKENYKELYFWVQGFGDLEYFEKICSDKSIKIISPNLESYSQFLAETNCDFVGTRLHAGIKAMQMLKRSIIIGVDNRARDMAESYGINFLERENMDSLCKMLHSEFSTDIKIDEENIQNFLKQFEV